MKTQSTEAFQVLCHQLKECQTQESEISAALLESTWNDLRAEKLNGNPSLAVMAALLLTQDAFHSLITGEEYIELEAIVTEALNHYLKIINPNNPVGRKLADAIKEAQTI